MFVLFFPFFDLKILGNVGSYTAQELFVILKKIGESDESSIIQFQFPDHIIKLMAEFSGIIFKNFYVFTSVMDFFEKIFFF